MKKIKTTLVYFLIISAPFVVTLTSYATDIQYRGEDFSAIKTTIDQGEKLLSTVFLSRYGYREEVSPNGLDKIIYLTNYKNKKTWMLVPGRKMYIEVESMMGGPDSGFNESTIFNQKPCQGFDRSLKVNQKQGKFKRYEEWQCLSFGTNSSLFQWFDPQTNLVVRERTQDGSDISIEDIKFEVLPVTLFQLPEGYRKGDTRDILNAMQ